MIETKYLPTENNLVIEEVMERDEILLLVQPIQQGISRRLADQHSHTTTRYSESHLLQPLSLQNTNPYIYRNDGVYLVPPLKCSKCHQMEPLSFIKNKDSYNRQ